jgi:hypothetical protein
MVKITKKNTISIKEIKIDLKPEIKNILEQIAEKCVSQIYNSSPKRTGELARNWVYEFENSDSMTVVIYNNGRHKTLSGLLEFGHKTRNNSSFVSGRPLIRQSFENCKKNYYDECGKIDFSKIVR